MPVLTGVAVFISFSFLAGGKETVNVSLLPTGVMPRW